MTAFWQTATELVMLPATALLGLVVFYWLLMIVAGLDIELLDVDFDLDADASGEGLFDWAAVPLKFLNVSEVPLTLWASIWSLAFFTSLLLIDRGLQADSWTPYLLAWARSGAIAIVATKLCTEPMRSLFEKPPEKRPEDRIGAVVEVTTTEVSETFGRAIYTQESPTTTIEIRSADPGLTLHDEVEIVAWSPDLRAYQVTRSIPSPTTPHSTDGA